MNKTRKRQTVVLALCMAACVLGACGTTQQDVSGAPGADMSSAAQPVPPAPSAA